MNSAAPMNPSTPVRMTTAETTSAVRMAMNSSVRMAKMAAVRTNSSVWMVAVRTLMKAAATTKVCLAMSRGISLMCWEDLCLSWTLHSPS
uniref:Uncharacterized protein n=1 Tax=Arundo donax TaxID=35708 RepID=A0A0A9CL81_ARUDO